MDVERVIIIHDVCDKSKVSLNRLMWWQVIDDTKNPLFSLKNSFARQRIPKAAVIAKIPNLHNINTMKLSVN